MLGKILRQRLAVGLAASGVAERIDLKFHSVEQSERVQSLGAQRDYLDVALRLLHADQFDADLVELAEPALLRALVAEHRAGIEKAQRQALRQTVGNHRPHYAGGILGSQRDVLTALVVEGVHLLHHDVGGFADRSLEDFCGFEDRRRDLVIAKTFGNRVRGLDYRAVTAHHRGQEVLGAAGGLKLLAQATGAGASAATTSSAFFLASISAAFFSTSSTRWSTMFWSLRR